MTSHFLTWRHCQNFFNFVLFFLSKLFPGRSFMSISLLVLELWQLSFRSIWPETLKLEISRPEFCPISDDWSKLERPNFAQMFLINCYWMLLNVTVTAFNVFELLRENQQGVGESLPLPRLGLISWLMTCKLMLQLQSSFRFACCNSDSWRRSTLKYLW